MPERRGSRFVVEALFLGALTVALGLARLDAIEIVGAMALGWLLVAALEWAAWRREPHFGRGLPPRYYLPAVNLPPPHPLEQVGEGYPGAGRDDAPTWIASASLRAEVFGEWPLAAPIHPEPEEEEEQEEQEQEQQEEGGFVEPSSPGADPWTIAALPAIPLDDGPAALPKARRSGRTARYSLDPLGEPDRRRFGRGSRVRHGETVEVAARPTARVVPSTVRPD
jgi:hypothetical protein